MKKPKKLLSFAEAALKHARSEAEARTIRDFMRAEAQSTTLPRAEMLRRAKWPKS